jgi:hypothetical protein
LVLAVAAGESLHGKVHEATRSHLRFEKMTEQTNKVD